MRTRTNTSDTSRLNRKRDAARVLHIVATSRTGIGWRELARGIAIVSPRVEGGRGKGEPRVVVSSVLNIIKSEKRDGRLGGGSPEGLIFIIVVITYVSGSRHYLTSNQLLPLYILETQTLVPFDVNA